MPSDVKLPIVLAHGIARFDLIKHFIETDLKLPVDDRSDRFHYFKGIKSHLESSGFKVFHTDVAFADSVEVRSRQMSEQINAILAETGFEKAHVIAHSMGGLDARHMIVDLPGMAEKIASLTTVGTPHLGTSLADFVLEHGGTGLVEGLNHFIHLEGFADLTTRACNDFNARAEGQEAANAVVYRTYASSQRFRQVFAPLRASWLFLNREAGESDGLVPVDSQRWKAELVRDDNTRKSVAQVRFSVPADHLNQVGWWDPQESNLLVNLIKPDSQMEEFEDGIKSIYLEMAQGL